MQKTNTSTTVTDEIDKYIFECKKGTDETLNPHKLLDFYPTIGKVALKSLPISATSVFAERVFSAAGLLDKQRLRNQMTAETMESCLLLRCNHIGERVREISYPPPLPFLFPSLTFSDIEPISPPINP